jgi:hypothetical protein
MGCAQDTESNTLEIKINLWVGSNKIKLKDMVLFICRIWVKELWQFGWIIKLY